MFEDRLLHVIEILQKWNDSSRRPITILQRSNYVIVSTWYLGRLFPFWIAGSLSRGCTLQGEISILIFVKRRKRKGIYFEKCSVRLRIIETKCFWIPIFLAKVIDWEKKWLIIYQCHLDLLVDIVTRDRIVVVPFRGRKIVYIILTPLRNSFLPQLGNNRSYPEFFNNWTWNFSTDRNWKLLWKLLL